MLSIIIVLSIIPAYFLLRKITLPYRIKLAKRKYGSHCFAYNPSTGKIYPGKKRRSIYD